jgi:hypothetical protein
MRWSIALKHVVLHECAPMTRGVICLLHNKSRWIVSCTPGWRVARDGEFYHQREPCSRNLMMASSMDRLHPAFAALSRVSSERIT